VVMWVVFACTWWPHPTPALLHWVLICLLAESGANKSHHGSSSCVLWALLDWTKGVRVRLGSWNLKAFPGQRKGYGELAMSYGRAFHAPASLHLCPHCVVAVSLVVAIDGGLGRGRARE